jgi:hypothetical protein
MRNHRGKDRPGSLGSFAAGDVQQGFRGALRRYRFPFVRPVMHGYDIFSGHLPGVERDLEDPGTPPIAINCLLHYL